MHSTCNICSLAMWFYSHIWKVNLTLHLEQLFRTSSSIKGIILKCPFVKSNYANITRHVKKLPVAFSLEMPHNYALVKVNSMITQNLPIYMVYLSRDVQNISSRKRAHASNIVPCSPFHQINFDAEYVLTYGRVMQPFGRHEQNQKIKLSFGSGTFVEVSNFLTWTPNGPPPPPPPPFRNPSPYTQPTYFNPHPRHPKPLPRPTLALLPIWIRVLLQYCSLDSLSLDISIFIPI